MIKTILVNATNDESAAGVYATAYSLARLWGAHIDALHVRLDPIETAAAMSTEGSGGALLQGMIDRLERDAGEREAKALEGFTTFCSRAKLPLVTSQVENDTAPSATFHVETGQEARWMAAYGRNSDIGVVSRGAPDADAVARSTLEALLLETGRPLLIPTAQEPVGDFAERIAIAWKPTAQAARAVAAAAPLLTKAKTVTVLTVDEDEAGRDDTERLLAYLRWHGITAAPERLTAGAGGAPATLLAAAKASAGLLVMGGYGHTRLREWVFGGFTQHVLDQAEIPVLMAH